MCTNDDLSGHFPPLGGHACLDPSAVRKLVLAVKPGYYAPATLEKCQNSWQLRVARQGTSGETIRRGITISDVHTAEWVVDYLKQARFDRKRRRKDVTHAG